jgi:hypothetical protein
VRIKYPKGATWEGRKKGVLYKIVHEDCYPFGMMFCIYITKVDGSLVGGWHWENFEQLMTIRAAMKFCRNRYYEDLRFRRIK